MTTHETPSAGAPCWIDVLTNDPAKTRDFYTALFGWGAEAPSEEHGGYINFTKDGVRIAGCIGSIADEPIRGAWTLYLASDDAKATVDAAVEHGATVLVPPSDVDDLGTMAVVTDPGGAAIGIWQPGTHPGFGEHGDDNTPRWFELSTRDHDASVAFYRDVFGWTIDLASDDPGFRYTSLQSGGRRAAGIMDATSFLPNGVPAHWSVYFGVADAETAATRIRELGGTIVRGPEDTPYGVLATATDSTGVGFKLMALNEAMPGNR